MKCLLIVFITSFCFANSQAQEHIKWMFSAKKTKPGVYEIRCRAMLEKGWHIYSQSSPAKGPVPTKLIFHKNPLVSLDGDAKEEGELENHYEEVFKNTIKRYSDMVDFVQIVKVKNGIKTRITGTLEYMICNDTHCMPPTGQNFSLQLN